MGRRGAQVRWEEFDFSTLEDFAKVISDIPLNTERLQEARCHVEAITDTLRGTSPAFYKNFWTSPACNTDNMASEWLMYISRYEELAKHITVKRLVATRNATLKKMEGWFKDTVKNERRKFLLLLVYKSYGTIHTAKVKENREFDLGKDVCLFVENEFRVVNISPKLSLASCQPNIATNKVKSSGKNELLDFYKSLESDTSHDFDRGKRLIKEKELEYEELKQDLAKSELRITNRDEKLEIVDREIDKLNAVEKYEKQMSRATDKTFDVFGRTEDGLYNGRNFMTLLAEMLTYKISDQQVSERVHVEFFSVLSVEPTPGPSGIINDRCVFELDQPLNENISLNLQTAQKDPSETRNVFFYVANDSNDLVFPITEAEMQTNQAFNDVAPPPDRSTDKIVFVDYGNNTVASSVPRHMSEQTCRRSPRHLPKELGYRETGLESSRKIDFGSVDQQNEDRDSASSSDAGNKKKKPAGRGKTSKKTRGGRK